MNLSKVTDTLAKHGVSHRLIAPHVMQIHWLVDGSSQPVMEYDGVKKRGRTTENGEYTLGGNGNENI